MARAVIISGGRISDYEYIKEQIDKNDTIICADSGYNHAVKMGIKPAIVVGDFDSAGEIPADVPTMRYPAKKDCTDTEIAIKHAREMGFCDFLIVGGTGSRMDHTLTNIFMLRDFLSGHEHVQIIDEHNKILITNAEIDLCGNKGDIVSLIPLSDCFGVTTYNLEYPLHQAALYMGKGLGVSNVMTAKTARVSISDGVMLVIMARD